MRSTAYLRAVIEEALQPLLVEVEFPNRYSGYGDRVLFAVFNDQGGHVYDVPALTLGWREVGAWLERAREEVVARGYALLPWHPPSDLRPQDS